MMEFSWPRCCPTEISVLNVVHRAHEAPTAPEGQHCGHQPKWKNRLAVIIFISSAEDFLDMHPE